MNYLKIQTDILKALCKDNIRKVLQCVSRSEDGNKIYLICGDNGSHFYILEKDFFFLDYEMLVDKVGELQSNTLDKILKGIDKSELGYKTDQLIHIETIKGNGVFLKSEKYEVVVNEKFLKNFDKNCTFYLSGDLAPVYIYEGYVLAGVILPIARKKEWSRNIQADLSAWRGERE